MAETFTQRAIKAWNEQADEYNQWDELGEDEKFEWFDRQASRLSKLNDSETVKSDYLYDDIEDYERYAGISVNASFRLGWEYARIREEQTGLDA